MPSGQWLVVRGQWPVASGRRGEREDGRGERRETILPQSALTLTLSQRERGQYTLSGRRDSTF